MRWNLKTKLIMPTFLAMSLGIACITYLAYSSALSLVSLEINRKIEQVNGLLHHTINMWLSHFIVEIQDYAENPLFKEVLRSKPNEIQKEQANHLLRNITEQQFYLKNVTLLDAQGVVRFMSDEKELGVSYQNHAFFQTAMHSTDIVVSESREHHVFHTKGIFFAQSIRYQDSVVGVLAAFIELDDLAKLFIDPLDLGNLGYAFILDQEGMMIGHPDPKLRQTNVRQFSFGNDMINNGVGFFEYTYNNKTTISFLSELRRTNWTIGVRLDKTEAFNEVEKLRNIIIAIGIILTIIVAIALFYTASKLLVPVKAIQYHLTKLAEGNPLIDESIEYNGHDEIADVVNATQRLKQSMNKTINIADEIAKGNYALKVNASQDTDLLNKAIANMTDNLMNMTQHTQQQDWLKTGQTLLAEQMSGDQSLEKLSTNIINFLTEYLQAEVGAFYLFNNSGAEALLIRSAAHACVLTDNIPDSFGLQDGVIGHLLRDPKTIILKDTPPEYLQIKSGLGQCEPHTILIMPVLYENKLKGAIELATLKPFDELQQEYLHLVMPSIAITLHSASARDHTQNLLAQMQTQAEELQSQAEELRVQQEELQQANEILQARQKPAAAKV